TRTEFDHAKALAHLNGFSGLYPTDNPPSDRTRDLFHPNESPTSGFPQIEPKLLIADGTLLITRVEKSTRKITHGFDRTGARNPVHMHVEDRQEDADAKSPAAGEIRVVHFLDMRHQSVGGTN